MLEALLGGGKMVWELAGNLVSGYEREKEKLLVKHVEPLQARLLEVHRDYIAGFEAARRLVADPRTTADQVVSFLEERRRTLRVERDLAKHLARSLDDAERRLVRGEAWSTLKAYCAAIDRYLSGAYAFTDGSMYTSLLRMARDHRRQQSGGLLAAADPLAAQLDLVWRSGWLSEKLDTILDVQLPDAFSEVNQRYAELRTMLG